MLRKERCCSVLKVSSLFFLLITMLVISPYPVIETYSANSSKNTNVVELGDIKIDKSTKEIRIRSKLAIKEGILEYLMVHNEGKAYESVFKVGGNKPSELNFALLLIGCKPLSFEKFIKLTNAPEGQTELLKNHSESVLEIEIYQDNKKVEWQRVIKNRGGSIPTLTWAYTGGWFMKDNKYVGDFELSQIGIWPDPSAPINLFSSIGNPYRGNFGLEINRDNTQLKVNEDYEVVIRRKK